MSTTVEIKIYGIAVDGLPDSNDSQLIGRTAFIWDGAIVSGWHPRGAEPDIWEPAEDRFGGPVSGVTHWVEFPTAVWNLEKDGGSGE